MIDVSMVAHVLQFASLLTPDAGGDVMAVAQERGWLDRDGAVTETGKALCTALAEQRETRSVFRSVF